MAGQISFFLGEDEVSKRIVKLLDNLVRELGKNVKVSSTNFIGSTLTKMKIGLKSSFGKLETLEIEAYTVLNQYRRLFESRFGVREFPAVRFGEHIYSGREVMNMASDLYSLLTNKTYLTAEQVFYYLADYSKRLEEIEARKAAIQAAEKLSSANVYRAAYRDRMAKLNKLLEEGKIDDETYRKLRKVYEELLSGRSGQ